LFKRVVRAFNELSAEPATLLLVPLERLQQISFGLWFEYERGSLVIVREFGV
jgi:hypothetical protein